ncbi:Hpt domain-containing protein [Pseudodesulfovibrio cashew]|uniref:Hpt domain-containing protein n=1 Tax=Pseudodesulfovibrio cashew TaxID=2678688 RepID=A0A6I6JHX7_9BACT|nr:Hpt domain-containing protein [Pseudodesulfovibrio cashew]QGY39727.1 Hpt domain-containing protein [Pseudodesulfovibrio cashew]
MTQSIFDLKNFLRSLADDDELARELLAAFMEDSPVRTASLREALANDDAGEAAKMAHSLKGMCGVIRSDALVSLALAMEISAKDENLDATREHFSRFSDLLDTAHDEMNDYINS